jgi:hypothetical protein
MLDRIDLGCGFSSAVNPYDYSVVLEGTNTTHKEIKKQCLRRLHARVLKLQQKVIDLEKEIEQLKRPEQPRPCRVVIFPDGSFIEEYVVTDEGNVNYQTFTPQREAVYADLDPSKATIRLFNELYRMQSGNEKTRRPFYKRECRVVPNHGVIVFLDSANDPPIITNIKTEGINPLMLSVKDLLAGFSPADPAAEEWFSGLKRWAGIK